MGFVLVLLLALAPASLDLPPEGINRPAADPPTATAERGTTVQMTETSPPPPLATTPTFSSDSSNGRCVGAEPLLAAHSPGWSVERMSRIMYRESRCQPGAYNRSGASGLLQILKSHCGWLSTRVGSCNLFNADYNIRAAAVLWREQGYGAWSTS